MPVRLEVDDDDRATVYLDRPAKRNALDRTMIESLRDAVAALRDNASARVVIVRGVDGVFSAGADIREWVDPSPQIAGELSRLGSQTFEALAALPQPSVAAIEGPAVGGGLELALACDIRIARSDATIGFPEARLGNLPAWGGMARLAHTAGLGVARHLLLTGDIVDAARAAELGVVTAVCPPDDFELSVNATVSSLTACDPTALAMLKTVLSGLDGRITTEDVMASYVATLPASRQRKQAFLDRKASGRVESPAST